MKRFLMLGTTQLDIKWLEIDHKGGHVTQWQQVPVKIYVEMPHGYVGPAKGMTINAELSPLQLEVAKDQWLTIVPEEKLPANVLTVTLPGA
jgi:hypothetical protein